MSVGKTQLVSFELESTQDDHTLYQRWIVKKDGVIRHLDFYGLNATGGVIEFKVMRGDHGMQVYPEAPTPSQGDGIADHFEFSEPGTFQHLSVEVFEPVRKGEEYRLWADFSKDASSLQLVMTILPVDALVTKLHKDTIRELARLIKNG